MPGPAPGIHVFGRIWKKGVDGRDNPRIKFGGPYDDGGIWRETQCTTLNGFAKIRGRSIAV